MTDRINATTVVLSRDTRDDDCEATIKAIGQIKGVLSVKPHVVKIESHVAYARARADLETKLWKALKED